MLYCAYTYREDDPLKLLALAGSSITGSMPTNYLEQNGISARRKMHNGTFIGVVHLRNLCR